VHLLDFNKRISSALNQTSLQLMFSEELFMLKSRLVQLHGAVRQFLDTGHEIILLLLLRIIDKSRGYCVIPCLE
jgi:hypothetical protein